MTATATTLTPEERKECTRLRRRSRTLTRRLAQRAEEERELAEIRHTLRYEFGLTWQSIADNDGVSNGAVRKSAKKITDRS